MGCQNSRDLGAAPSPELVPVRTDASAAAEKRPEAPAAPADAEAPPAAAPAPDEAPAADEAAASDEDASVDLTRRRRTRAAAAADVASAYGDYFGHIRFARGWETAPFRREDAAPLFDTAALACALIRSRELDGARSRSGRPTGPRDWFHGDAPDPVAAPRQFVDGLVHATFQDGAGYVEGLDERRVDELLDEYVDWSSAAFAR
ncbi:hypothetical protein JL722_3878 [Aureococcus anophagefferens]|nr:hypothetical protein JL722_3878 [Aureococcus anophagefferens]